jgi:hypothetical protein
MYAITRPLAESALADVPGMLGSPARVVPAGGLACVVSTVDLADFGEQALPANFEDPTWVERVSRAHDDVVRSVATLVTTAPLPLASVCNDDAAVQQRLYGLGAHGEKLLAVLDGRDECGLKLVGVTATRQADDAYAFVAAGTVAARRHRPQDARLSGLGGLMQLDASFLVARDGADAFRRSIDAITQSLPPDSVQLTGPLPPYSFTALAGG